MAEHPTLRRTLSLPLLTFYGLGTILGAGIYVLVGEVAGIAGMFAPIAFLVAATIAGFTAFSYAELSSRIPRSAGEAAYLEHAFGSRVLAACAGWGVVITGIVSAATVTNGFIGYLEVFMEVPDAAVMLLCLLVMGALAVWGVGESVVAASIVTVIEVLGLVFVIALAGHHLGDFPARLGELTPSFSLEHGTLILLGGYLAFFAFIGFEDIVNMAEEVKEPQRNLPKAIIICLVVSTLFYIVIAMIAVLAMPPESLSHQKAPLAEILAARGPWAQTAISLISMVAVINGALIQIIMAARVLYGMASQRIAPAPLAKIHPRTRTPALATVAVTIVIMILAVGFPLVSLAKATSTVTLFVFALVNAALWKTKCTQGPVEGAVNYPLWLPVGGFFICVGCLVAHFVLVPA